jgi:hypothetical protein
MNSEYILYQTVYYGNPFEALELNLFTSQELINYLVKNIKILPKERLYLSFSALMRYYPSDYHYSDRKHILTYLPDDKILQRIFVIMGGSPDVPSDNDDPTNTLWSILFDIYTEYMTDTWSEEYEKYMLLCNKVTSKLSKRELYFKDQDFIKLLYEYRCDKIIALLPQCGFPESETIHYSIETDWFDQYPNVKKYYKNYITRIEYLKKMAPDYLKPLTEQFLFQLCTITLKDFEKLDYDLLKRTCKCFPQQFTDIDLPEPYQRLCIYPIGVRSYILGLSCFPKIPNKNQIDQALTKLSEMGIDEYVKTTLEKQNYPTFPEDKIANTEDTLFENPSEYVSLDRFEMEENGKIYQFTRPEFKKLYTDKKNFWTKQPLSYSDLYTLQIRNQLCKELNLPQSDTMKLLIEKGCKGCLYEETLVKENPSQSSNSLSVASMNASLLYLYQLWSANPNAFQI